MSRFVRSVPELTRVTGHGKLHTQLEGVRVDDEDEESDACRVRRVVLVEGLAEIVSESFSRYGSPSASHSLVAITSIVPLLVKSFNSRNHSSESDRKLRTEIPELGSSDNKRKRARMLKLMLGRTLNRTLLFREMAGVAKDGALRSDRERTGAELGSSEVVRKRLSLMLPPHQYDLVVCCHCCSEVLLIKLQASTFSTACSLGNDRSLIPFKNIQHCGSGLLCKSTQPGDGIVAYRVSKTGTVCTSTSDESRSKVTVSLGTQVKRIEGILLAATVLAMSDPSLMDGRLTCSYAFPLAKIVSRNCLISRIVDCRTSRSEITSTGLTDNERDHSLDRDDYLCTAVSEPR
nr:hypothetical protein CFP56_29920 [Quercus suber]